MTILSGFKAEDGEWKNGRIYDPESGKTYRSRLRLNKDGSLKVSGCVFFICQSQRWTRQRCRGARAAANGAGERSAIDEVGAWPGLKKRLSKGSDTGGTAA